MYNKIWNIIKKWYCIMINNKCIYFSFFSYVFINEKLQTINQCQGFWIGWYICCMIDAFITNKKSLLFRNIFYSWQREIAAGIIWTLYDFFSLNQRNKNICITVFAAKKYLSFRNLHSTISPHFNFCGSSNIV